MLRLAFVFPGQGSQYPGMGRELADHYAAAAEVYEQADEIAGYALSSLCFEGPPEQLNQTAYAQPAILVASLAALAVLREAGINAVITAGLSLGEYSALVASGAMDLRQALPLVQLRGRLMQEAVPAGVGAMAAVTGLENEKVEEICDGAEGYVVVANYNCPGQVVISGEAAAVQQAGAMVRESGGRAIPLVISVPCHCRMMYDAAMKLKPELEKVNFTSPSIPVVSNVNSQENPADAMAGLLVAQLYSPVRWEQNVRYMMERADYFVEIGPGTSLSGMIKRIDRSRVLGNVENCKSLDKIREKVVSLCQNK